MINYFKRLMGLETEQQQAIQTLQKKVRKSGLSVNSLAKKLNEDELLVAVSVLATGGLTSAKAHASISEDKAFELLKRANAKLK